MTGSSSPISSPSTIPCNSLKKLLDHTLELLNSRQIQQRPKETKRVFQPG